MIWRNVPWDGIVQTNATWVMNAQIEKSFFDKRLSLTVSCDDIFSTMAYRGNINFGNINQSIKETYSGRQILLTARYSFGSQKIRGARNRSVGIEDEMGRTK